MFFTSLYYKIQRAWEYIIYPSKYYAKKYAKQYVEELKFEILEQE